METDIYELVKDIQNMNRRIENKLDEILSNMNKNKIKVKELIKEKIKIEESKIIECLKMNKIEGELRMFKMMYLDNITNNDCCIRFKNNKYEYYDGSEYKEDVKGIYIKNTIMSNIETLYYNVNTIDNYNNIDIVKNQEYIYKLSESKHKDKLLSRIINLLNS